MKDHPTLCKFLSDINERGLIQLGGALGLHYPKLQRMKHLPEEMVAAWLRGEDQVLDVSGRPTWASLVKCLEEVGQTGIANTIKFWYVDKIERPKFNESSCCNDKWLFRLGVAVLTAAIMCLVYYWPTLVYEVNFRCYSKTLPYHPSQNFFGRDREIKEVMRLIDFHRSYQDIHVINIIGSPGFGKSTLAIHVGHQMVRKNVVVHYINLADFPDKPSVKQVLPEKVLESSQISAKSADLDRLVRWASDRFWYNLIILDNCDHVVQIQREDFQLTLERLVETSKNVKVLMTSRVELVINPYSKSYLIHELSTEAACKVLEYGEQHGQVQLTNAQKLRVANKTGNVPLAISIFKSLLDRVGAPPPEHLIRELESPIKALSPPDFQLRRQVNATLCMSYNYLRPKLQVMSRQLTLFPGSFSREAGVVVLSNGSQSDRVRKDIEESLTSLVRSSLIQYNQRKDRYQYHQLIKEYFLHISNHNDTITLYPAYYIHYATLLNIARASFSQNFEVAIAIIESDRHNFHHLLNALKNMSGVDTYFFTVVAAILDSVNVGLLNIRFPIDDLHVAMTNAIDEFDTLIWFDTLLRAFDIETYYTHANEFFHYYVLLMTHLQTCGMKDKDRLRSMHNERKHYIEAYRYRMNHTDYINFNQHLIQYYNQINDTERAREYRIKIMIQIDRHEFLCPHFGECTYDSVGSASYEIGEYQKAALLYEKALEKEKNGMKVVRILSALVRTYSKLNEYDKMFETADRLCVQQGIRNIMNSSISELIWHYRTVAVSLNLCEEFRLTEQAHILFKNYTKVLLQLLSQMDNAEDDMVDDSCQSPSFEVIYSILEQMYDIEYYEAVITIGSRAVQIVSKNSSFDLEMLSNKLRFQLLVGKAKVHGYNFDTSDGMRDIEDVLQIILNLADGVAGNFTKERKIACWYLIPQVKYIRICYNVTSTIRRVIMNLIFTPLYYKIGSDGFAYLHTQCNLKSEQAQILLSSSTDLQISVEFMLPISKLWQKLSDDIESPLLYIDSCQILLHFEVVAKLSWTLMDVHLLWIKLIFPYIVYIYFRRPYLFKEFMAELEFWYLQVPSGTIIYNYTVIKCFPTMPKETIQTLLFGPGILRVVRDPRLKYGDSSYPHARYLIDMPGEDAHVFTSWCSLFISVNFVFLIYVYSHQIFRGAFL